MPASPPALTRRDGVIAAALVATLMLTWVGRLSGPIDLRWDGAAYYILGTSLSELQAYRFLNEPGELPAVVWPPLLPAFVAAHQVALQTSDPEVVGRALRLSFVGVWTAHVLVTFLFFRALGGRWFSVAGTLLTGLHISVIWVSDRLYADLPFALALTSFMLAAVRQPRRHVIAGLLASAAYLLRTAGVAVLAAWVADAALRGEWRGVLQRLVLASVPILAWHGYVHYADTRARAEAPPYMYALADYALYNVPYSRNLNLRDPDRPHLGYLTAGDMATRIVVNLQPAVSHLGQAVSISESDWARLMARVKAHPVLSQVVPWAAIPVSLVVFGVLVVWGAVIFLIRGPRMLPLALGGYLATIAVLPDHFHWPRYLGAVAPVACACFLSALLTLRSTVRPARLTRFPQIGATVAAAVFISALGLQIATAWWYLREGLHDVTHSFAGREVRYKVFTYDEAYAAFDRGVDWLRARADEEDVVVSSMPHWVYVRTNLRAVLPPYEADVEVARAFLATVGARFVVIDNSGFSAAHEYARPAVAAPSSGWRLVHAEASGLLEIYESVSPP